MLAQLQTRNPIQYNREFCPPDLHPFDTVNWKLWTAEIKDDSGKVIFKQEAEFPDFYTQISVNVVASKYFYGPTDKRENSLKQLIDRVCGTIAKWAFLQGYFGPHGYPADIYTIAKTDKSLDERKLIEVAEESIYKKIEEAWNSYWAFRDDLTWLCLHQHMAFNSPVWFNVGTENYGSTSLDNWAIDKENLDDMNPNSQHLLRETHLTDAHGMLSAFFKKVDTHVRYQCSACFIQRVDDELSDIMDLAKSEALLFKFGSGTGTDLSRLRSSIEFLSSGGKASGPLSFMRIWDQVAGVVKSGGKTRRAAKMQSIHASHPDSRKFITCKRDEERKGAVLRAAGYITGMDSASEHLFYQNANLSLRTPAEFYDALENKSDWDLISPKSGKKLDSVSAVDLWEDVITCAWECGDPGIQYDTEINRMNPVIAIDKINASNPCSEYMFIDDSACNLASLNLCKFADHKGTFKPAKFRSACFTTLLAQEVLVDAASYPTKEIAINSHLFRPLGLGYANLGALLMKKGLPYDSGVGRNVAACITSIMHETSIDASSRFAEAMGPYTFWNKTADDYKRILQIHQDSANKLDWEHEFADQNNWTYALRSVEYHGLRNAQVTLLAPTGTIAFMMGCDTTGIEPDTGLVKRKNLAGGGVLKMINEGVVAALDNLGYTDPVKEKIFNHLKEYESIEGCKELDVRHLAIFDCAFAAIKPDGSPGRFISPEGHVDMMAACQPFLSGAISKTVNMPNTATPADIGKIYLRGFKKKLKAIAIYRDGSKGCQALTVGKPVEQEKGKTPEKMVVATRRCVPPTCPSIRHKFEIEGHKGYMHITCYEDGSVAEIFIKMAKEGSVISGLMDSLGVAWSLLFQHGVPFETMYNRYRGMSFNPMGWIKSQPGETSKCPKAAKSIVDYIFRWIALNCYNMQDDLYLAEPDNEDIDEVMIPKKPRSAVMSATGDACPMCGSSHLEPSGKCTRCMNCGNSMGCAG